jgi:hypothetical protein
VTQFVYQGYCSILNPLQYLDIAAGSYYTVIVVDRRMQHRKNPAAHNQEENEAGSDVRCRQVKTLP